MHDRNLPPTLLLAAMYFFGAVSTNADWEKLPPLPEANGGFSCGIADGKIIVVGGTNWVEGKKIWLDDAHLFDPDTSEWRTIGKLSQPFAYGVSTSVERPDSLALFGGTDGASPRRSWAKVDPKKVTTYRPGDLPSELVLSAGAMFATQFIIAGGTDDAANIAGLTRKAIAVDLSEYTVTELPDYPGRPFGIAASVSHNNELFIFGGANWHADTETVSNTTECYAYSVHEKSWRQLKDFPLDVRGHTAIALDANRIYIAGGYGGEPAGFLSQAFIYNVRTDSYTEATPLPYAATAGLVILDGYLYCIGGEDEMKSRTAAFWRIPLDELQQQPLR